jgi:putative oxidoreductase
MTATRAIGLLTGRSILGTYLAAHGAQKLFGSFDGPGIEAASAGFHHLGLRPGPVFARVASVSEIGGGVLTAAGAAHPLGPVVLAGTMAVAAVTHRANGPLAAKGGYELPLTNLAAAVALAVAGPGRLSWDAMTGRRLPASVTRLVVAGALAVSAASVVMIVRTQRTPPAASDADAPEAPEADAPQADAPEAPEAEAATSE